MNNILSTKIEFILNEGLQDALNRFNNPKIAFEMIKARMLHQMRINHISDEQFLEEYAKESKKEKEHALKWAKEDIINSVPDVSERLKSILINWLITNILKKSVKWEDLYKSKEYFENFYKYSNKIKQKDITKYNTLQEVYNAYKPFLDLDNSIKDPKSISDSKLIYEDENCIIIQPLTVEASCALGKGTEWCTAADPKKHDNMFKYYNEMGGLYIYFDKKTGKRIQYNPDSNQMMDMDDNEFRYPPFYKLLKQLNLLNWEYKDSIRLLKNGGIVIVYSPNSNQWIDYYDKDGVPSRDPNNGPAKICIFGDQIISQTWIFNGKEVKPTPEQKEIWFNKIINNDYESKQTTSIMLEFRNIKSLMDK